MQLPYMLDPLYRLGSLIVFEKVKPYVRGWYNYLNKIVTYGRADIFVALDIEINSNCNKRCAFCPVNTYDRGDYYMTTELFKKIIKDLADFPFVYRGRISPHFFGEPLMDDRLVSLMAYTKKHLPMAILIIHTNGLLLNNSQVEALVDAGVNGFIVTTDNKLMKKNISEEIDQKYHSYLKFRNLEDVELFKF